MSDRKDFFKNYRERNKEAVNYAKRRNGLLHRALKGAVIKKESLIKNNFTEEEFNKLLIERGHDPIQFDDKVSETQIIKANKSVNRVKISIEDIRNFYISKNTLSEKSIDQYVKKLKTLNNLFNDNNDNITPLLNNPKHIVENFDKKENTIKSYFTPIIYLINYFDNIKTIIDEDNIDFIRKYFNQMKEQEAITMLNKTNDKTINFKELMKSVKDVYTEDSKEYALYCLYDNYGFRDDLNLIITDDISLGFDEVKYNSDNKIKQNYLYVSDNELMVFLNHYKTVRNYGRKKLIIHKHETVIRNFLKNKNIGDRLFDVNNIGLLVSRINKKILPDEFKDDKNISINFLRHSLFTTYDINTIDSFNHGYTRLLYRRKL